MLAIMTAIFTLMSLWTPLRLDDNVFLSIYREMNNGSDVFSWRALIDSWINNRLYDNARISNFVAPLSTIVEPWCSIFPCFAGLSCTAMILLTARLTGIKRNPALALALAWMAIVVLLPWRNAIFVRDYMLNYPFSAVISLSFVMLICADGGQRIKHPAWFAVTLACAVLLGSWHEGFSIPVCAGLGVWCLTKRAHMPRQWWAVTIVLGLTTLLFLYCPGMLQRLNDQFGKTSQDHLFKLIFDLAVPAFTVAFIIVGLLKKSTRAKLMRDLNTPVTIVMLTATIMGSVMSVGVQHTPRMSFFPILCSIIVLGRLMQNRISRIKANSSTFIISIVILLCTAQGCYACVWQYRLKKEYDIVERLMLDSPHGTAFYDFYRPEDVSPLTLYYPSRTQWVDGWAFYTFDLTHGYGEDHQNQRNHAVVPVALRHPCGLSISGNDSIFTDKHNIWSMNMPKFKTGEYIWSNIEMKDGTTHRGVATVVMRFVSEDGDTLLYINPLRHNPAEITAIELYN